MDRWTEFQVFVRVAEERSITRSADALNLSVSGVSRHLMNLEARLGAKLVQRSTRQLSLTGDNHEHRDELASDKGTPQMFVATRLSRQNNLQSNCDVPFWLG